MSQAARPLKLITVEEYLEFEERSSRKHEYVDGQLFAMSGASKRHVLVTGNIFARLWQASRGGPCQVYASDLKLKASAAKFYYPDVVVVCDDDEPSLYTERPCLVVEVLSRSASRTDRSEKLLAYQQLPSLETYLIVDPNVRWVEVHRRTQDGWRSSRLEGEGEIELGCPRTVLTLADIYEGL